MQDDGSTMDPAHELDNAPDISTAWQTIALDVTSHDQRVVVTTSAMPWAKWKGFRTHIVVPPDGVTIKAVLKGMPAGDIDTFVAHSCTLRHVHHFNDVSYVYEDFADDEGLEFDQYAINSEGPYLDLTFKCLWPKRSSEERALAFAMAWHTRLGADSLLHSISSTDVCRMIVLPGMKMSPTYVFWRVSLEAGSEFEVYTTDAHRVPVSMMSMTQEAGVGGGELDGE